jgi:hypothetical protein
MVYMGVLVFPIRIERRHPSMDDDADDDVDFDPDAYGFDDDDGTTAVEDASTVPGEGARGREHDDDDDVDFNARKAAAAPPTLMNADDVGYAAVATAMKSRSNDEEKFREMLREKLGASAADARWERALMKIQRDARFKALKTHSERRTAFEAFVREAKAAREAEKKRKRDGERGDGGDDAGRRRREEAIRARERETAASRERDERDARRRKTEMRIKEAEEAFTALCGERVKTYSRSYDEAYERDLAGDPMGRDDVSAIGETRARELYEAHRAAVEATLKTEFDKLARRILDRLVVQAMSDGVNASIARRASSISLDAAFDGALAYARAAQDDFELVDDVLFVVTPDEDKRKIWNKCAVEILARHDVVVRQDENEDAADEEDGAIRSDDD